MPDNSVDLIVTSPPYNVGKEYETQTSLRVYLDKITPIIDEAIRVLKPTGNLAWEVGNYIHNKEVYPLDIYYYDMFKQRGLQLRNRIIWHFGHGLHAKTRFSGRYETILWFTKTDHYTFNLDPVRIPAKYPGKKVIMGKTKENYLVILKGKIQKMSGILSKAIGKEKYGILSMLKATTLKKQYTLLNFQLN